MTYELILSRLKYLSTLEKTPEVEASIYQLCGEYGGLQREEFERDEAKAAAAAERLESVMP